MLKPEDQANFVETGKQASDIGFPVYHLIDSLRHSVYEKGNMFFLDDVRMIAMTDDGVIDEKEGKLIAWARGIALNLEWDDIWEAEDLMHKGFFEG